MTQSALMPSEQPVTRPAMFRTTITVIGTPIVTPGSGAGGGHPAVELGAPQHVVQQQPAVRVRVQRARRRRLGIDLHAGEPDPDAGARGQHRVGPVDRAGSAVRGGQRAAVFVGQDDHPHPQRGRADRAAR